MKEIDSKKRTLDKIFRITFRGGRGLPAFVFDSFFFGAASLLALYLCVRPQFKNRPAAVFVTAVCGLLLFLIVLVIDRERFARHVKRMREKAAEDLLLRKAFFLSEELFKDIKDEGVYKAISAEALTADDVIRAVREFGDGAVIVTLAKPTEAAKALLDSMDGISVVTPFGYLSREPSEMITVNESEIDAEIIRTHRKTIKKPSLPKGLFELSKERAVKYFALGAALLLMSFFVRYSLYFRIISSVVLSLGAGVFAFDELKRAQTINNLH